MWVKTSLAPKNLVFHWWWGTCSFSSHPTAGFSPSSSSQYCGLWHTPKLLTVEDLPSYAEGSGKFFSLWLIASFTLSSSPFTRSSASLTHKEHTQLGTAPCLIALIDSGFTHCEGKRTLVNQIWEFDKPIQVKLALNWFQCEHPDWSTWCNSCYCLSHCVHPVPSASCL